MHAIGNYIIQNTNLKVLYVTTDEFMNEFISITRDSGNREDNLMVLIFLRINIEILTC